jgi:F-type H+-transporting ATPase subunit alpha
MQDKHPSCRELVRQGKIDDALAERLKGHIAHFKEQFLLQHPNKAKQDDVEQNAEPVVVAEDEDAGKAQE